MKRILLATVIMFSLVFSLVGTAQAITDGELDGNGHPYVGLMVAQDADGVPLWRCSGTLLSSTIFLTAGHCAAAPAAHVEIWFAADVQSGVPPTDIHTMGMLAARLILILSGIRMRFTCMIWAWWCWISRW